MEKVKEGDHVKEITEISLGKPHKVILYNDESHSMDEVVMQIMIAIHCDTSTAYNIMMKAHNNGSAIVYTGHKEKCELVSSILEEIRLGTKVEQC
jgi:ATP-dependent Clp protease adaptor protein ClpS